MLVLPADDRVPAQVADICSAGFATRLDQHPADVGPEKSAVSVIRIEFGVGVSVVRAMSTRPPFDGAFDGAGASQCEGIFKGLRRVVRTMGPETMVAYKAFCCLGAFFKII